MKDSFGPPLFSVLDLRKARMDPGDQGCTQSAAAGTLPESVHTVCIQCDPPQNNDDDDDNVLRS